MYDTATKQNLTEARSRKLNRVAVDKLPLRARVQARQGRRLAQARAVLGRRLPVLPPARERDQGPRQRDDLHVPVPDRPAASGRRAQVEADLVRARQGEGVGRVLRVRQGARQQGRLRRSGREDAGARQLAQDQCDADAGLRRRHVDSRRAAVAADREGNRGAPRSRRRSCAASARNEPRAAPDTSEDDAWRSSISSRNSSSTSSSGPTTRAIRCRTGFPTRTRRSRTARS